MNRPDPNSIPVHTAWGLAALAAVATLGEGGASPTAMLAWHSWLLLLVLMGLVRPGAGRTVARGPLLGYLVFTAIVVVGVLVAPYGYAAWLFLLELIAFGAVVWLAACVGPELLTRIRWPLLFAASAQSIAFLVQKLVLGEVRPAGSMLNPNHLAAWLLAVLLIVLGDWPIGGPGCAKPSRFQWICLIPLAIVLATIGSRGALLGLVAGVTVVIVAGWATWSPGRRRIVVAFAVLAVVVGGAGIATRLRQFDPFRYQRIRIWSAATDVISEHPWSGSGPRQFAWIARNHQFPDGDGPLRYDRGFRTTHSDWLRVPAELGWPATLVLALTLFASIRVVRRSLRERSPGAIGAVAALCALATQGSVENLSLRPAVYLLAAVLLGSLLSVSRGATRVLSLATRLALALFLVVGALVGDVAPYLAWRAARGLPDGRLQPAQINRLRQALVRNPLQPDYPRKLAAHLASGGGEWDLEGYAAAREAAERSIRLNPLASEGLRELGRVEARGCTGFLRDAATRRRALEAYRAAESRDRFNPFIPMELSGFLLDAGEAKEAGAAARRALGIEPESVRARLLLAAATLESDPGASEEAARLLTEAREKAIEWKGWSDRGDYARELLSLDPDDVARLERKIASAEDGANVGIVR